MIKTIKFSPSTSGFYLPEIHGSGIPSDAIDVDYELYLELMESPSGKVVKFDQVTGLPKLVEPELIITQPSKQQLLNSIVVTLTNGKVFDGNETARTNIMSTLYVAGITGQTTTNWKLADNTTSLVTKEELEEALTLAIQEVGRIVGAVQ